MSAIVFIPLTQGKVAVIDFADFEKVRKYKWVAFKGRKTWYARCSIGPINYKLYLHRLILNARAGVQVDHRDGDGLNNTQHNLRSCSNSQNHQALQIKHVHATSRFRGVCWDKKRLLWFAQTKHEGRHFNIGRFASEEEAARAYDAKAKELFGEFASPNFP